MRIPVYTGNVLDDVFKVGTIKNADAITGGLSNPSKMPEYAYSLPASRCKVGSLLKHTKGTVCSLCYAADEWEWVKQGRRGNRYASSHVREALERRYQSLDHPLWVPAMTLLIRKRFIQCFRWHDSGDLQSVEHLQNIGKVAEYCTETRFWLPTREFKMVRGYEAPDNLCIRLSAHYVDGKAPDWPTTSRVVTSGHTCPAREQGGNCGECRACWDRSVPEVLYPLH